MNRVFAPVLMSASQMHPINLCPWDEHWVWQSVSHSWRHFHGP